MSRHVSKADIWVANEHTRWCSTSAALREMQIKTTARDQSYPLEWLLSNTSTGEDAEKSDPSHTAGENGRGYSCCRKQSCTVSNTTQSYPMTLQPQSRVLRRAECACVREIVLWEVATISPAGPIFLSAVQWETIKYQEIDFHTKCCRLSRLKECFSEPLGENLLQSLSTLWY